MSLWTYFVGCPHASKINARVRCTWDDDAVLWGILSRIYGSVLLE